jgi:hypothetical protein
MLNKKKTLWSHDLDMFAGEDAMRWSFGGGKAPAPPPPPPPADNASDGRPDDAKSTGIAAAAKTRSSHRSQGSRGGLKIGLTGGSKKSSGRGSSGLNVPGVGQTAERSY